jgi:hypothetical protein
MSIALWFIESRPNEGGWVVETCGPQESSRPNGLEVNPRGQGPRAEADASRRLPAFEARDAGGVTPFKYR